MKRNWLTALVLLLVAGLIYLLTWPVPIDPAEWTPEPRPSSEDGPFAYNEKLAGVEWLARDFGSGPEAIAIGPDGALYTGYVDGRVVRLDPEGGDPTVLADTEGRPLGLSITENGEVIVADAVRGLMKVSDGYAYPLSVSAAGVPYRFVDDVDYSSQSRRAYFSDASSKFGYHEVMADVFEHRGHGRIMAYDLDTDAVEVLADGLYFANGVALGPDEDYLLFTETTRYRVQRLWLKGDRAGETEVLIDNLPGFPDNITFNGRDRFWLAIYAPRTAALDALLPRPFLRKMIFRLPESLQPGPGMHAFVLGLDLDGNVVANLQYKGEGACAPVTSAIRSRVAISACL